MGANKDTSATGTVAAMTARPMVDEPPKDEPNGAATFFTPTTASCLPLLAFSTEMAGSAAGAGDDVAVLA